VMQRTERCGLRERRGERLPPSRYWKPPFGHLGKAAIRKWFKDGNFLPGSDVVRR
jgi:hypothetical protein